MFHFGGFFFIKIERIAEIGMHEHRQISSSCERYSVLLGHSESIRWFFSFFRRGLNDALIGWCIRGRALQSSLCILEISHVYSLKTTRAENVEWRSEKFSDRRRAHRWRGEPQCVGHPSRRHLVAGHWLQIFQEKYFFRLYTQKYVYFHFDFAEGQSIKVPSKSYWTYQNIGLKHYLRLESCGMECSD